MISGLTQIISWLCSIHILEILDVVYFRNSVCYTIFIHCIVLNIVKEFFQFLFLKNELTEIIYFK